MTEKTPNSSTITFYYQ